MGFGTKSVTLEASTIKIDIRMVGGDCTGTLDPGMNLIWDTWRQCGGSLTLSGTLAIPAG